MEIQNSSSSNILSPGSIAPELNPIEEEIESEYKELTVEYLQELKAKKKLRKEKKKKAKTKTQNAKETSENDAQEEYPDPTLGDGEVLPQYYGKFPDNLLGVPIEDLDANYKEKGEETFCVVTNRFSNKYIYRFSATNGFFLLSPFNPVRRLALRITLNQFFDYFVMLTIIVNCAFLALDNEVIESEYVFTAIYTLEMIIKMLARGFVLNKFTYLRDLWNWLDFVVVILAYVTIISTAVTPAGSNFNVSGLRTFRVLRAFKSFTIVPGLKTIVNALLQSLKPLAEVMVIMIFLVVVISLIALQAYQGVLLRKCVLVPTGKDNITTNDEFNAFVLNPSNWNPVEGELQVCGNTSSSGLCPAGYKCMQDIGENPNYGFTNFDHMGWALLTCFQLLTLDYWENVYNMIIRAEGAWNVLFFFMSVVLGPFYLLNLLLAVVTLAYSKEHEKQTKLRELREKAKENARRRNKRRRLLMQMVKIREEQSTQAVDTDSQQSAAANGNISTSDFYASSQPESPGNMIKDNLTPVVPIIIHTGGGIETPGTPNDQKSIKNDYQGDISSSRNHLSYNDATGSARRQKFRDSRKNISLESSESSSSQLPEWKKWFRKKKSSFEKTFCAWNCHPAFKKFQKFLFHVISLKLFEGFIILSIVTNTLFLALDHHEISQTFDEALSIGNLVFTAIFTAEAVLKIFALGPLGYVKDKWNVFDFLIVVISLIEVTNITGDAGLSVLRTLRLMRVFRLARIWQTMRKLMSIIIKSLSAVAYLTIVLFMVLFIFAVIGKQMYSESYANSASKFDGEVPRWNFINFYNSFLLVWRVMCGEWIELLHECMFIADYTCIPVFLAITFIGNFLVLNLFTAILLEAFNVDNLKTKQADKQTAKLKLGVEAFRKLLKKSQSKSSSNAISPENKAESSGTDAEDTKNVPSKDDVVGTPDKKNKHEGRKSLSAANIFTLHQASMRIRNSRTTDNGLSANGYQSGVASTFTSSSSDENTTYKSSNSLPQSTGQINLRKPLVKQYSMSAENFYESIHEGVGVEPKPEIIKIEEENPANSNYSIGIESPTDNQNITKKVSFVVSNNSEADSVTENVLQPSKSRVPWYKRCGKEQWVRCCRFKAETQDVDPESNSSGVTNHDGQDSGEENKQPKEAPNCFPKCCPLYSKTCYCGKSWAKFRYGVFLLVQHKIFEFFILTIILASTVCLALEDINLETDITRKNVLNILEYVFTSLFTLEMALKWIGNGFTKYFTNWWCILDFVIVVISWVGIGASAAGTVDSLRALRTLRALRPLRAISRWQGMRVVVNALIYCIPSIGNVLCVCLLIWLVFSIMGVQLYKGQFYRCVDANGDAFNSTFIPNRNVCLQNNFTWTTPRINFDNVVNGMIALFQVATFEGWIEVMSDASDTDGVYNQPTRGANPYSYLFFFVFVLIGSFFILNLIVGVIIESFQKLRKQTESSSAVEAFLTESQKNFYKTMRTMLNRKPKKSIPPPKNVLLLKIFKLVTHSRFEVVVFVVIVLNMLTLGMEHYRMSQNWADALRYVDIGFTTLFAIEAFLKLCGTRLYYFRDAFNVFDFVVVLLSITGFILEEILALLVSPTLLRVVRVFRVFRVLRVIRAARGIRRLILTLMISLPALFNIAVLLGVFMVIFAILGMSFFMNVKLRGALNDIVNFRTFGNSMMLLFRLMTSAGWNDVLEPLMDEDDCEPKECGNHIIAVIYFVLYIFFVFLVVVNMYIAIILENFDEIFQQEETGVSQDDFEYFYVIWGRYDPKASQFVSIAELSNLLHSLHPPFQLAKPNEIKIAALNLPIVNGDKVHCLDVLFALVKRILGEVEISDEMRQEAEARLLKSFPNRKTLKAETTTLALRQKVKAAKIIQEAWRGFRGKRKRGIDSTSSEFYSMVSLEQDLSNLSTAMPFVLGATLVPNIASQANVKQQLSVISEKRNENADQNRNKLPSVEVQAKTGQTEITIVPGPTIEEPGSTSAVTRDIPKHTPEEMDYINECTDKREQQNLSPKGGDSITAKINNNVSATCKPSDDKSSDSKGENEHKTTTKKAVERSKSHPILKSTTTSSTDKLRSTNSDGRKMSLSEDNIKVISQSDVPADQNRPQTATAVSKTTVNTTDGSLPTKSTQGNQELGTSQLISINGKDTSTQMRVQTATQSRKSKLVKGETFPPSTMQSGEPTDNQSVCTSKTFGHMDKTIVIPHPVSSKTDAFDVAGKLDDVTLSKQLTPSPTDENRVERVKIVQSNSESKIAETKLSQIASSPTLTLANRNTLDANPIGEKESSKQNINEAKPIAAKDLRFNPKTGKFKTKTNVIELVEVPGKPLDDETSKNKSIDQSMILKNNHVVE